MWGRKRRWVVGKEEVEGEASCIEYTPSDASTRPMNRRKIPQNLKDLNDLNCEELRTTSQSHQALFFSFFLSFSNCWKTNRRIETYSVAIWGQFSSTINHQPYQLDLFRVVYILCDGYAASE